VNWLVDGVMQELEDLAESLLVLTTCLAFGQFKVNFCKVHADGLWQHLFEECICEVKTQPISFVCASALEFTSVDAVDIEGNPVVGLGGTLEVHLDLVVDLWQLASVALSGVEAEHVL